MTDQHLCYTNKKRKRINAKMMIQTTRLSTEQPLELPELPYDKNSQPVSLIVGAPIIARVNKKAIDLFNNETYTITGIDHQTQTITATNETQELLIPFTNFQQMFYPAFCITIHKSQGQSYDNPYTIHEWDKLDERLKYVALSRSTDLSLINVI